MDETKVESLDSIIDGAINSEAENETINETETTEQGVESAEETSTEQVVEVEELKIPENWRPEDKEFINSLEDPKGKKVFFDKYKSLEDGYSKKFNDLAGEKKTFEEVQHKYNEYNNFEKEFQSEEMNTIKAQYGSVPQYMNSLVAMDRLASQDPSKFLINYCNNNGITQENLQEVLTGKAYQNVQQENSLDRVKQELRQEWEDKIATRETQQQVESFISAVDESGQPKHPHFENVRNTMASLQDAYPEDSIETLYEKACYADQTIRAQMAQSQADKQAKDLQAQNDVIKAKAATGVKTSTGTVSAKETQDWRKSLSQEIGD